MLQRLVDLLVLLVLSLSVVHATLDHKGPTGENNSGVGRFLKKFCSWKGGDSRVCGGAHVSDDAHPLNAEMQRRVSQDPPQSSGGYQPHNLGGSTAVRRSGSVRRSDSTAVRRSGSVRRSDSTAVRVSSYKDAMLLFKMLMDGTKITAPETRFETSAAEISKIFGTFSAKQKQLFDVVLLIHHNSQPAQSSEYKFSFYDLSIIGVEGGAGGRRSLPLDVEPLEFYNMQSAFTAVLYGCTEDPTALRTTQQDAATLAGAAGHATAARPAPPVESRYEFTHQLQFVSMTRAPHAVYLFKRNPVHVPPRVTFGQDTNAPHNRCMLYATDDTE